MAKWGLCCFLVFLWTALVTVSTKPFGDSDEIDRAPNARPSPPPPPFHFFYPVLGPYGYRTQTFFVNPRTYYGAYSSPYNQIYPGYGVPGAPIYRRSNQGQRGRLGTTITSDPGEGAVAKSEIDPPPGLQPSNTAETGQGQAGTEGQGQVTTTQEGREGYVPYRINKYGYYSNRVEHPKPGLRSYKKPTKPEEPPTNGARATKGTAEQEVEQEQEQGQVKVRTPRTASQGRNEDGDQHIVQSQL